MVQLTEQMKESLAAARHAYIATATKDGTPNVVPVGTHRMLDDETLLISDQFFNKTAKNLKENPKVAISFWGEKGGFQLKGIATVHTGDEVFKQNVAYMKVKFPNMTPKAAVTVKITDVYNIKSGADAGKKIL